MLNIKILSENLNSEAGELPLSALNNDKFSVSSVHQVVKATLAGRRQGNHSTKTRSMVSGGGKKPFKQKGTGRARQGSTRSPLMPGGGIAFGPSPRNYSQKLNKKQVLNALNTILLDKINSGALVVTESFDLTGKTKELNQLLTNKGLESCYIVTASKDDAIHRAARNLSYVKSAAVTGFSVYEAVKYSNLILTKASLEELLERLVR